MTCIGCKQCVWCAPATFRMEPTYGRSRVFAQVRLVGWLLAPRVALSACTACPATLPPRRAAPLPCNADPPACTAPPAALAAAPLNARPPTRPPHLQWLDTEDNLQAAMDACPVSCIHWVSKDDLPALEFVCQNKVRGDGAGGRGWPARAARASLAGGAAAAPAACAARPSATMPCILFEELGVLGAVLALSGADAAFTPTLPYCRRAPQVKRTNVAAMMAQQGFVEDVFGATQKYLKERRRK